MVIPENVLAAVEEGDISAVVAWLDAGGDVNDVTPAWPGVRDDADFFECHEMVRGVRAAGGSWKEYVRAPPKALLRLRSLVARGRARSVKRLRARTPREIELLLAPTFPNELCWRVLEYWNPRA